MISCGGDSFRSSDAAKNVFEIANQDYDSDFHTTRKRTRCFTELDRCHHQSIGTERGLRVAVIAVRQSLLGFVPGLERVLSALLCGSFANFKVSGLLNWFVGVG
jgi:hypothetical protein